MWRLSYLPSFVSKTVIQPFPLSTWTRARQTWSNTSCTSDLSSNARISRSLMTLQDLLTDTASSWVHDSMTN